MTSATSKTHWINMYLYIHFILKCVEFLIIKCKISTRELSKGNQRPKNPNIKFWHHIKLQCKVTSPILKYWMLSKSSLVTICSNKLFSRIVYNQFISFKNKWSSILHIREIRKFLCRCLPSMISVLGICLSS